MIIFIFFELLIGLVIGFYLSDKKRGISFKEMKFGAIAMMIVTSTLLFIGSAHNAKTLIATLVSGLVIFTGVFTGELLKIKLTAAVVRSIQKDNIYSTIRQFVAHAKFTSGRSEGINKEFMDVELYKTVDYLRGLADRATKFKQDDLAMRIHEVMASCITLNRLSTQMTDADSREKYEELADTLLDVSWDTLTYTEQKVKRDITRNWHTLAFAMKVVHTK